MKTTNLTLLILIVSLIISCVTPKNLIKNSVFSSDAIQANDSYFTKAILEYHLVDHVLKKFNINKEDSKAIVLSATNIDNKEEMLYDCSFDVPTSIEDLTSGFQYRYYLFTSKNSAALQAFGITDIKGERETQYLVIDYIQFRDYNCPNLPTIRYAVGLRSELRFYKVNDTIDITGKGSLSKLAANVELGNAEVNFSLKTIGLTGKPARLNIPQGVSFNVTTYKDFQNSIVFLKNNLDEIKSSTNKDSTEILYVNPEIIPVMDEYLPNSKKSLSLLAKEVLELSVEKEKLKEKTTKFEEPIRKMIDSLYDFEINRVLVERKSLNKLHNQVFSLAPYTKTLGLATISRKNYKINKLEKLRAEVPKVKGEISSFFPGYPNLNKLDVSSLSLMEQIFYNTDEITFYEFHKYLNTLDLEVSKMSSVDLKGKQDSLNNILTGLRGESTLKGLQESIKTFK